MESGLFATVGARCSLRIRIVNLCIGATGVVPDTKVECGMAQEADDWADGGEAWMLLAACRGRDPDLFFTNDGLSKGEARSGRSMYAEAKSICASCDVRLVCLEYAIGTNQMYGLWGGKSRAERSAIRTKLYKRGLTLWN